MKTLFELTDFLSLNKCKKRGRITVYKDNYQFTLNLKDIHVFVKVKDTIKSKIYVFFLGYSKLNDILSDTTRYINIYYNETN